MTFNTIKNWNSRELLRVTEKLSHSLWDSNLPASESLRAKAESIQVFHGARQTIHFHELIHLIEASPALTNRCVNE